jgi:protease I
MSELSNLRVAILAADGVEEAEMVEPLKAMRDAGLSPTVLSPSGEPIQMMNHDEKTTKQPADGKIGDQEPSGYDALVLPGGAMNADGLRMVAEARAFAKAMDDAGKPMAVICHAPWVLVSAGLTQGRTLTSYYTVQDDIRNAGGTWVDQEVVIDGNWITSRSPKDLPAFNRELLAALQRVAQSGTAGRRVA